MLRFLRLLFLATTDMVGWFGHSIFQGLTGRNLAAEATEEAAEEARQVAAEATQAQADADRVATLEARAETSARHEETTLLAEQQLAESRAMREELARVPRRRNEIASQSRSHDVEVRSSRWTLDEEPKPGSGAPMPA